MPMPRTTRRNRVLSSERFAAYFSEHDEKTAGEPRAWQKKGNNDTCHGTTTKLAAIRALFQTTRTTAHGREVPSEE